MRGRRHAPGAWRSRGHQKGRASSKPLPVFILPPSSHCKSRVIQRKFSLDLIAHPRYVITEQTATGLHYYLIVSSVFFCEFKMNVEL